MTSNGLTSNLSPTSPSSSSTRTPLSVPLPNSPMIDPKVQAMLSGSTDLLSLAIPSFPHFSPFAGLPLQSNPVPAFRFHPSLQPLLPLSSPVPTHYPHIAPTPNFPTSLTTTTTTVTSPPSSSASSSSTSSSSSGPSSSSSGLSSSSSSSRERTSPTNISTTTTVLTTTSPTGGSGGGSKSRPQRVQWTKELHDLFVSVVDRLGSQAIPSKILAEMNVAGLTREHISSHLQKYRQKNGISYPPQPTRNFYNHTGAPPQKPSSSGGGSGKRKVEDIELPQSQYHHPYYSHSSGPSHIQHTTHTHTHPHPQSIAAITNHDEVIEVKHKVPSPSSTVSSTSPVSLSIETQEPSTTAPSPSSVSSEKLPLPPKRPRYEDTATMCKTAIDRITRAFVTCELSHPTLGLQQLISEVNSQVQLVENLYFEEKRTSAAAELLEALSIVLGQLLGGIPTPSSPSISSSPSGSGSGSSSSTTSEPFAVFRDEILKDCAYLWMMIFLGWSGSISERKRWHERLKTMLSPSSSSAPVSPTSTTGAPSVESPTPSSCTSSGPSSTSSASSSPYASIPTRIISLFEDAAWIALHGWDDENLGKVLKDKDLDKDKCKSKYITVPTKDQPIQETPQVLRARIRHLRNHAMDVEAERLESYYYASSLSSDEKGEGDTQVEEVEGKEGEGKVKEGKTKGEVLKELLMDDKDRTDRRIKIN